MSSRSLPHHPGRPARATAPAAPRRRRVAIVGTGVSGIGMAIALRRAGHEEITLFERGDDGREIVEAGWDQEACTWTLTADDGRAFEADILVLAGGQLSRRRIPTIPGADRFAGPTFHSAECREHAADGLVRGAGVDTHFVAPMRIYGRGGRELAELWGDAPRAHHGITVASYPNLFLLHGPNTNLGVGMIEAQVGYVVDALACLDAEHADAMDVDPTIMAVSDAKVQARLQGSIWPRCHRWHRRDDGRVTTTWPGSMREYAARVRRVRPAEYAFWRASPRASTRTPPPPRDEGPPMSTTGARPTKAPAASTANRGIAREEVAELGLPLGPNSLTWRYYGDIRGLLVGQRVGVLQNMHPVISQTLIDHSILFENPYERLRRSTAPIMGVVYDRPDDGTGEQVRDLHKGIKGTDLEGRAYRALDPEAFFWAHATFFEGQLAVQELLGTPLSEHVQERLYRESITLYARYGMSLRPVPRDYAAFRRYWEEMFGSVLEATPVARYGVRRFEHQPPPAGTRRAVWAVAGPIAGRVGPWTARVTLPPEAREILGVTLSSADRAAFRALRATINATYPLLPHRRRRQPRAYVADLREGVTC